MIHCSAQRERCWAIIDMQNANSHPASREAVLSMLLTGHRLKLSCAAVNIASIGRDVPAIAPLPKGEARHSGELSASVRIPSASNIRAQANASAPAEMGC